MCDRREHVRPAISVQGLPIPHRTPGAEGKMATNLVTPPLNPGSSQTEERVRDPAAMTVKCDGGVDAGGEVRSGGQEREDEQRETREAAIQRYSLPRGSWHAIPDCANQTVLLSSSVSIHLSRTRMDQDATPRIAPNPVPKNEERPTRRIIGEMIACTTIFENHRFQVQCGRFCQKPVVPIRSSFPSRG